MTTSLADTSSRPSQALWAHMFTLSISRGCSLLFLFLTNCSTHTVKLGKRCTKLAEDNTYEKSLIWLIDKKNIETFDQKINKKNCKINGENG